MIRPVLALAAVAGALVGCAATTTTSSTSTTVSPSPARPSGADTLRDYAAVHGPQNFFLPAGLQQTSLIDNPNVVTMTTTPASSKGTDTWLAARLPSWGWQVDAHANGSIVFHDAQWQGAWTCSSELCAVTLRNQPS